MKPKFLAVVSFLFVLIVGSGSLLVPNMEVAQAADETSCTLHNFVAAVREGPTKGWAIAGDLNLKIAADGSVTGTVTSADDKKSVLAGIVGQITGRAVNLAFDLGKPSDPKEGDQEYYLYGTGTMINLPAECKEPMGGLFAGPQPGDIGDWDICQPISRPGLPLPPPCVPTRSPDEPIRLPTLAPPLPK